MELERKNEFESKEFEQSDEIEESNGLDSPAKSENDSSDLPPESCRYRDEGCELAESCLNCPFAKCIYDEPGGKQRWMKRLRVREIARLHTIEGKKVKELSEMFGISERTVQGHLANIYGKLGVSSRTEAVTRALQLGWIVLEG